MNRTDYNNVKQKMIDTIQEETTNKNTLKDLKIFKSFRKETLKIMKIMKR